MALGELDGRPQGDRRADLGVVGNALDEHRVADGLGERVVVRDEQHPIGVGEVLGEPVGRQHRGDERLLLRACRPGRAREREGDGREPGERGSILAHHPRGWPGSRCGALPDVGRGTLGSVTPPSVRGGAGGGSASATM